MTNFEPQTTSPEQAHASKSYMELGQSPIQGDEVTTLALGDTEGMFAYGAQRALLDNRKAGLEGTLLGIVPGYGGDVWYVDHTGEGENPEDTQAVYTIDEIAPKTN